MRGAFSYFGGKSRLAPRIVELLPPHRVYLEPFAGSLAVLFAKRPAAIEIVNDLDDGIVTFFRMLRDHPADLTRVCALTPYARREYEAAVRHDDRGVGDLGLARRLWVRVNQSHAKVAGRRTGWSRTVQRSQSPPRTAMGRVERFHAFAERLRSVLIEHCDGIELIAAMATDDTVIYADPPYLGASRTRGAHDYLHEFSDTDHHRLADVLHTTPATVVLSGYPSALYDDLYGDWGHVDIATTALSGTGRPPRTERLWCNRPPAVTLWDHHRVEEPPVRSAR